MIERMVLLGASGDLTSRLLLPAVAQLAEAGLLPSGFSIVGAVQRRLVAPRTSASTSPPELEKHAHGHASHTRRGGRDAQLPAMRRHPARRASARE